MSFSAGHLIPQEVIASATREVLREYSEASGDPNPIHLDEVAAKKAGLPNIIAHGMLVAGWVSERARRWLLREGLDQKWGWAGIRYRFRAMTLLNDAIAVGGQVKESSDQQLIIELDAKNPRGEVVIHATLTLKKK